uniref:Large ribosomal subunit protein eL36 n=1 Tax=Equus asinus asinus TaxID=83772 RepID=A0A8C4L472_EQUAS
MIKKGVKVTALCHLMASLSKPRHSCSLRCLIEHTKFLQDMIQEVCGFALNEWCTVELLSASKDKPVIKLIKKREGTHCTKRKQEELSNVLATMEKAAAKRIEPPTPTPLIIRTSQKKKKNTYKMELKHITQ